MKIGAGLPGLLADERRVKQILINLLSNAIKFTPAGGRVGLDASLDGYGRIVLKVSDTGIGIAPEDLPKAMAMFGQVDGSLTRHYEGTGLGLPLARRLAELHGALFEIASQPGEGTAIRILFPRERSLIATGERAARPDKAAPTVH